MDLVRGWDGRCRERAAVTRQSTPARPGLDGSECIPALACMLWVCDGVDELTGMQSSFLRGALERVAGRVDALSVLSKSIGRRRRAGIREEAGTEAWARVSRISVYRA